MKSEKKHILIISQYFYPEQFRINDISQEWVKRGYKVTVLTGIPNYPAGKFFDGYGYWEKRREWWNGIEVIRIPLIPRGHNAIGMIANYMSFVASGFFWKSITKIKADTVFVFGLSPMTQALVGVWYGKKYKVPVLVYVQDLWPESVEAAAGIHNRLVLNRLSKMMDYIYRNCKYIFATSPSFVQKIEERESVYQNGKSKVVYWPQYAENFYQPASSGELKDISKSNSFKIIFTGNIGYAQGLNILPETAAILKGRGVCCEIYIVGDGRYREELERVIQEKDVDDMFHLLGRKNPEEIPNYLANCDFAFLSFADNMLFEMTIPAKLQSYLACGIPVIASARGETERVIKEAGAGMICRIGDALDLADKIEEAMQLSEEKYSKMRENALRYSTKEFSSSFLLEKMDFYLKEAGVKS